MSEVRLKNPPRDLGGYELRAFLDRLLKGQRFRKLLLDWQDFVEAAQLQNLPDGRGWAAEDQAGLASLGELGEIEQRAKPG